LRVVLNRRAGGPPEEVCFNVVYQPMRNQDGRIDGIAVLALDVTEVVNARREAEAANFAKDEFLAMLGHELRSPLSPILTAIRLLQLKGPQDPKLEQLRETILRQTMHLSRLVDDLLDVGRIIAGKLSLDRKPVELRAIVKQAVETCTPLIERRQHVLRVTLPDTPVSLDADPDRMVQVVCNLVNNAAKYTREGGRIELTASEAAGWAVIRVSDSGVGIAPEMLDRIFDRFLQIGTSRHRAEGGLGIGLSLVKAIVDLHGGRVTAYSGGIGQGSEFTVRLPIQAPHE
jgi:signal transduction histidine kinase